VEASSPALEFRDVTKRFGEVTVLTDFGFSVAEGETVTLIGPSGSGKTTVLRLAMMLERPDAGDVLAFGESLVRDADGRPLGTLQQRERARLLGMVFQQYNLFPHMTVRENISLALRTVLRLGAEESDARTVEHVAMVGLGKKLDDYPLQLSGGQQQRIALARALALRPRILLLDEITSALDPELVGEVLDLVRTVTSGTDITTLIVTHEMQFARRISDRIVMMADGGIVEVGPPEQLFTDPRSERTRTFLRRVLEH
jgi:polar amino acid transport system ATP-binding protein